MIEVLGEARHLDQSVIDRCERSIDGRSIVDYWNSVLSVDGSKHLFSELDGRWISRMEFWEKTELVARVLFSSGLRKGERILICCDMSISMLIYYVAALRLGLVVVPVNTSYTRSEIGYIVYNVKPSAAVVDSFQHQDWILEATSRAGFIASFAGPGEDLPLPGEKVCFFNPKDPIIALDIDDIGLDEVSSSDAALVIYTSGTTGKPKGAVHTQSSLLACAVSLNLAWRWSSTDRLILSLPLFHVHGLGVGINGTLTAGAECVLVGAFDPVKVSDAVGRFGASLFFGVPTMYQRLVDEDRLGSLKKLRLMVSGSAPLSTELYKDITQITGRDILERYGATETLITLSNPYDGPRIPGHVGYPLPFVKAAIDNQDHQILISGPMLFSGYLDNDRATKDAFMDGWFLTGDAGEVGLNGSVAINGRLKDLIISGGFNVYPREVEEVLNSHIAVKEVAVVGEVSRKWGEKVVAFVIRESDVGEDDLINYASQFLAAYKRPKKIYFVLEFPRNAMGKVVASELRELAKTIGSKG